MIKFKWQTWFRVYLVTLALIFCWSVWRAAAQNTNATPTTASAATNAAPNEIGHVGVQTPEWMLTLADHLPFLTKQWFGNEVWKYLFSLVYIFLAFYVSKFLDYLTRVWLKNGRKRRRPSSTTCCSGC